MNRRSFLPRIASAAVGAAFALATRNAQAVAECEDPGGVKYVAFSPEEMKQLAAMFAAQRARIAQLEEQVREFNEGKGCS